MAGYVGARPRGGWAGTDRDRTATRQVAALPMPRTGLGGRAIDLPRRHARGAVAARSGRRQGRLGLIVAGIVVTFALGLFSLSQTVRVSANGYDVDRLLAERAAMENRERALLSDINRLGREPAVRQNAVGAGLGQLPNPLVIPAR